MHPSHIIINLDCAYYVLRVEPYTIFQIHMYCMSTERNCLCTFIYSHIDVIGLCAFYIINKTITRTIPDFRVFIYLVFYHFFQKKFFFSYIRFCLPPHPHTPWRGIM